MTQHISIRIPWRDQPWDDRVCENPLDNSSCLLLQNIGDARDDSWEMEVRGRSIATLADPSRLPCLAERGTFMSSYGYTVEREHPYRFNKSLKEHLLPTKVAVPPFSFEAVPFRWLSRETVEDQLWTDVPEYQPERERDAHAAIGFKPGWLMDGRNQRAMIDAFFEEVHPDHSIVLMYLKHSPFQEQSNRRLLVGASIVKSLRPPEQWNQSGRQPFDSSMWETIVSHSLRPDMSDGVLLPYQRLVPMLDDGADVAQALAWAPEDSDPEFSYVTEHVSDDTAIAALTAMRAAIDSMNQLGLDVPMSATRWIDAQVDRLWQIRGPVPGLAAVLAHLGVETPRGLTRRLSQETMWERDPWAVVEDAFRAESSLGMELRGRLPASIGHSWRGLGDADRSARRVLSGMQITADQVSDVLDGTSTWEIAADELVDNPYYAATCTHRGRFPISLSTVDQACFPAIHVEWTNVVETETGLNDPGDARRVEALIVQVLEDLAASGDTIVSQSEALSLASEIALTRACPLSGGLLNAYSLDGAHVSDYERWTPLIGAASADGTPSYKLEHLARAADEIRDALTGRRRANRFDALFDARDEIDQEFGAIGPEDVEEELARVEKAAGLEELFSSRLSVLVGAAGTGKTTLLKRLVAMPGIMQDGVLLLAPTGKATVQLQSKVGQRARTLASFLVSKGGFDPGTGQYIPVEKAHRERVGLVIIDEASMLTEEMLAATLSAVEGVKRLILVGDHRQLPPIGPGRPFVDIVEWLRPDEIDSPIRVGPNYIELTVSRRQKAIEDARDDLALAKWFSDEQQPADAEAIWQKLRVGIDSSTLGYQAWGSQGIAATLTAAIERELALEDAGQAGQRFELTYGGRLSDDGKYVNWLKGPGGSGEGCEEWQILTPTRSRAFGTVELNRFLKRRYRSADLDWAQRYFGYRPPKPIGPEQIVMGDKVMQTRNDSRAKAYPDGSGLDYVANGEIGVVIGRASKSPSYAHVELSSQVGATYSYRPSGSEDAPLELAWAVTVHKSQGSEFGTTFLVLPSRVHLSRELIYTALTRQTKKIVILHEGTVDEFVRMSSPTMSETARRMTDLFRRPVPRELTVDGKLNRFDANLIHVAPGNVMVRSKNEVILASIFEGLVPDRWAYERPLTIDGVTKYPDFTLETASGEEVIWEHLGMMSIPKYAASWAAKKEWYSSNGYRIFDDPDSTGSRGVVVWTDDSAGVDHPGWVSLAETVLGARRPERSVAKKAPGRRDAP